MESVVTTTQIQKANRGVVVWPVYVGISCR